MTDIHFGLFLVSVFAFGNEGVMVLFRYVFSASSSFLPSFVTMPWRRLVNFKPLKRVLAFLMVSTNTFLCFSDSLFHR